MSAAPDGKGHAENVASPESNRPVTLAFELRKINQSDSAGWRVRGEWILARFQRSGSLRDLRALETHLAGTRQRLSGGPS